jgi:CobQ-like glutamine amidotransferase family enzyme
LELRLAHLYPRHMNLYGDRGNIMALAYRCRARGISLVVEEVEVGEPFHAQRYDMVFIGGAQDREQRLVSADLQEKALSLRQGVEEGLVVLAVCGGYQLLGHYYRTAEGEELPGIGLLDIWTVHPGPGAPRLIGNAVVDWHGQTVVGFENHGGRTYLGPGVQPLGRVLRGFGNNGQDGTEGATYKNVFGTYLHGPLLPKNPHLADHLIYLALARRHGHLYLAPLDDALEVQAHHHALLRAYRPRILSFRNPVRQAWERLCKR